MFRASLCPSSEALDRI